ncbi:MAG TPA: DUF2182 domain-containing protein [Albitalea sp.]|uniref:DUF2182 domain-containing protein n=1 Tax=Piscinibacter sp. TaxID=1903157 RepID=UPI002ED02027
MIHNRHEFANVQFGVLAVSLAAWITIAALPHWSGRELSDYICSSAGTARLTADWALSAGFSWMLMTMAMMAPLTLPAIAHIRISSFASRRSQAIALFSLGFATVWMLAGFAMRALEAALRDMTSAVYLPAAVAALVAGIWQASPYKQRCLNRCHSHDPLSAFGLDAHVDAIRFGLRHGLWCVGTCWALMLMTVLLPQRHVAAMAIVSVLTFCERLEPPGPPLWRPRGLGTACLWLRREVAYRRSFRYVGSKQTTC